MFLVKDLINHLVLETVRPARFVKQRDALRHVGAITVQVGVRLFVALTTDRTRSSQSGFDLNNMSLLHSRKNSIVTALCGIGLSCTVLLFISHIGPFFIFSSPFDTLRSNRAATEWLGPSDGEQIDLTGLKSESGQYFSTPADNQGLLISIVDPNCPVSRSSTRLINSVQVDATKYGVRGIAVSFSPQPEKEFFLKVRKDVVAQEIYLWSSQSPPTISLKKMITPSHILVNSDGRVERTFPGSSSEKEIRELMAVEIGLEIQSLAQKTRNRVN